MGVGAAMVGAAAVGAAGSIFSGIMGASGAQKSAAAMRYAADKSAETMLTMNQRAREDTSPFRQMGLGAGNAYWNLLSGGGDVSGFLKESPMFQFQSEIGTRNINRQLAARGLFGSGAGLETLAMFNKGLAADEGERIMSRLFNMTTMGANAATGQATLTNQTGNAIGNMQAQMGISQGNAIQTQYNALGQGIQGGFNAVGNGITNYGQYQMYQPMMDSMSMGGWRAPTYYGSASGAGTTAFQPAGGGNPFIVNTPGATF